MSESHNVLTWRYYPGNGDRQTWLVWGTCRHCHEEYALIGPDFHILAGMRAFKLTCNNMNCLAPITEDDQAIDAAYAAARLGAGYVHVLSLLLGETLAEVLLHERPVGFSIDAAGLEAIIASEHDSQEAERKTWFLHKHAVQLREQKRQEDVRRADLPDAMAYVYSAARRARK